jgi:hypothetical protein
MGPHRVVPRWFQCDDNKMTSRGAPLVSTRASSTPTIGTMPSGWHTRCASASYSLTVLSEANVKAVATQIGLQDTGGIGVILNDEDSFGRHRRSLNEILKIPERGLESRSIAWRSKSAARAIVGPINASPMKIARPTRPILRRRSNSVTALIVTLGLITVLYESLFGGRVADWLNALLASSCQSRQRSDAVRERGSRL